MIKLEEALQLVDDIEKRKNTDMRIYQRSNEYLKFIFENIDVIDKKVLTVLGSSDQLFAFLYEGASIVDTFDINPLTEYYFYLRKWCILNKITYPLDINEIVIKKIIEKAEVNSSEEKRAQEFWLNVFQKQNLKDGYLFFNCDKDNLWDFPLDSIIMNFDKIILNVIKARQNFKNIDVLENFEIQEKYDYIYMSNILQRSQYDRKKLKICADNLQKILNENGIVLCTNFLSNDNYYKNVMDFEREIMKDFEFAEKISYNPIIGEEMPIYYTYTKKKLLK